MASTEEQNTIASSLSTHPVRVHVDDPSCGDDSAGTLSAVELHGVAGLLSLASLGEETLSGGARASGTGPPQN